MEGPIDYWSRLSDVDIGGAFDQSFQAGLQRNLAQQLLQHKLQQQQELEAARAAAIKEPSAANYNRLFILDPGSHEAIKAAHGAMEADQQKGTLSDLSAIRGYLRAGRPEDAGKIIQRRIDADKKAGHDTADDEQMLSLISEDPEHAAGLVDYQLAGIMGPDKWEATFKTIGDAGRADAELPSKIAQNVGAATLSQATAAKTLAEAKEIAPNAASERSLTEAKKADLQSQIQFRADSLGLERDKLETNTGLELEKLAQAREFRPLSGAAEQTMTSAVVSAESSRQLATRAADLAEKIKGAQLSGGWGAWLAQNAQGAFGNPNLLRKEYATLINSQAVKNLPPGPASDKDIKLALQGFPPPTANAETMASFLTGMSKLQNLAANREQARADWISENGNLGKAKRDITVNGVRVPAGANWMDFSTSQAAAERRQAPPERSYMRFGDGQR